MTAAKSEGESKSNRGRKPVAEIPSEQRKHLTCLSLRVVKKFRLRTIAAWAEVADSTVYRWLGLARAYPEAGDAAYLASLVS